MLPTPLVGVLNHACRAGAPNCQHETTFSLAASFIALQHFKGGLPPAGGLLRKCAGKFSDELA